MGLTSRVAAAAEDARRLADVAGGRLAPAAAAAVGALAAVGFLSEAEVVEVVGRLAGAAAPPTAALLGRVLAAAVSLVALVAGCPMGGSGHTGGVESKMKRDRKRKEK